MYLHKQAWSLTIFSIMYVLTVVVKTTSAIKKSFPVTNW
jgi:hypothetical protein